MFDSVAFTGNDRHVYADQLDRLTQMQFSAMSFVISPEQTYVAFRGTDNTIVGWKEKKCKIVDY